MSRQTGRDIDDVRDATDLVQLIGEHVVLKQKGREFIGLCPFHDDHRPSMSVVTHKGNAFYKCHSCGAAGDVFNFVMNYHKMDFAAALRYLAERAGVTLTKRRADTSARTSSDDRSTLHKANEAAMEFFQRTLASPRGDVARNVIANRCIDGQIAENFGLGAAPDAWDGLGQWAGQPGAPSVRSLLAGGLLKQRKEGNGHYDTFRNRLIFPICDDLGRPVAFGGRILNPDDEPKYLNSPESPVFNKSKTLYGLHLAKRAIIDSQQAIVTEGYTDVIACHQAGFTNVVATLGTALTKDHAQLLSRLCDTVVLIFDGDEAGIRAADRAVEVFFAGRLDVRICVLPDNLDPDDLLRLPDGVQRFQTAIDNSIDAIEFKLERFRSQLSAAGGLSATQRCLEEFGRELSSLGFGSMPGIRQALVVNRIAGLLGIAATDVQQIVPKQTQRNRSDASSSDANTHDRQQAPRLASLDVPRVRCRAEYDLLCLLIAQPELADALLVESESSPRVVDVLVEDDFLDPNSMRVASAVLAELSAGRPCTMQQLLAELDDNELHRIATELYFEGERRIEATTEPPAELIREAYAALRRLIGRDDYEQSLTDWKQQRDDTLKSAEHLAELIRGRSQQGDNIAALPRVR